MNLDGSCNDIRGERHILASQLILTNCDKRKIFIDSSITLLLLQLLSVRKKKKNLYIDKIKPNFLMMMSLFLFLQRSNKLDKGSFII